MNSIEKIQDIEEKIFNLILSAEFFNNYTIEMNNLCKNCSNGRKIFTIHSNIYFRYVLSVLKTLFEYSSKPKEQSFSLWRKEKGEQISGEINDFNKISDLYEKSNLKKFRNKITDHRENKKAGDVLANFLNPVKDTHTNNAKKIINELEDHAKKYFIEEMVGDFISYYKGDMDKFKGILMEKYNYKKIKNEIKKK